MKLYLGTICCSSRDEEVDVELIVAEDSAKAEEILKTRYSDFMEFFRWSEVVEITQVDGYKISVG